MKILQITSTFEPSINGVAVSVKSYSEKLRSMGHEVYVIAPKFPGYKEKRDWVIRYPSIPNPIRTDYPIPLIPINMDLIKLIRDEKFDIIHAHHPFYISFFADLFAQINNSAFVFTYHTRYDEYFKKMLKNIPDEINKIMSSYSAKTVLKKADIVIAPSKFIKSEILKIYSDAFVEVLPTGVSDLPVKTLTKTKFKSKYLIPSKSKILLCITRLAEEKNVELLINMLQFLDENTFLVIVGGGPMEEKLKNMAETLHLNEWIRFVGKIPHDNVGDFYKNSDLFVFPSVTETQGLILLEALHFGLPIVAVDCEVNREWVSDNVGIISKNDPKDFALKINILLKSNNLDFQKKKANAAKIASRFTTELMAEKLVTIYKSAIKNKNKKQSGVVKKGLEFFGRQFDDIVRLVTNGDN